MKQLPKLIAAVFLSILFCIPAAFAIFYYTIPMEDMSYELFSLGSDGEEYKEEFEWSVYTDEAGEKIALSSNGYGGYSGLSYPGQTFYYSHRLTEALDSPMLRIGVANRSVSVFLDEKLIYTDCPEQDNRIGYLTLPMQKYDRAEPVTVSLPPNYQGKMLTIAQSAPTVSETQTDSEVVWPCEVTLYCGYAYESSLISSASKTMIPAAMLFMLLLFLLAAFIWNTSEGIFQIKLAVFALAVLFQMCSILSKSDFFYQYFGLLSFDPTTLFFDLSIGTLLLFLTLHASRLRLLFAAATAVQWVSIVFFILAQIGSFIHSDQLSLFFIALPQIVGFFALTATLFGSFFLCKTGNRFFRRLTQTAFLLIVGYAGFLVVSIPLSSDYAFSVFSRIISDFQIFLPNFSLRLVWNLCLISTLAAVFLEFGEQISEHRTEVAVLSMKNQLTLESYENLRLHTEEIMMVRHDIKKHYLLLQSMIKENPHQASNYLDELIGQTERVRPVISCRNKTLEILLNGKLSIAASKGIPIQTDRCSAPENLPLSDAELCSLVTNILDNAIASAAASQKPFVKLDFYCKGHHFIFSCENSVLKKHTDNKKTPISKHGYGLKIIRQIMHQFGDNMLFVGQEKNVYTITFILPL